MRAPVAWLSRAPASTHEQQGGQNAHDCASVLGTADQQPAAAVRPQRPWPDLYVLPLAAAGQRYAITLSLQLPARLQVIEDRLVSVSTKVEGSAGSGVAATLASPAGLHSVYCVTLACRDCLLSNYKRLQCLNSLPALSEHTSPGQVAVGGYP